MGVLGINLGPREVTRSGDKSPARSVWRYVWLMTGWHQAIACALALVVAGLNLIPLELQRRIIDDAIMFGDVDLLLWLGAAYVAAFLALRVIKFVLRLYQGWMTESAVRYTRGHLIGIYCERDRKKDEHRPGEAVSVVNSETDKLGGFVGAAISQAVSNGAMLLGIMGYMLWVETEVALFALAVLIPQAVVTPLMQNHLNKLTKARLEYLREFGDMVAKDDVCTGDRTTGKLDLIYKNQMNFYIWKFLMKGILNLLNGAGPIIVLIFGGWMAVQGETTVGVLVAFVSGFERLSSPVRELITFYRESELARVQHDMIAAWMTDDPDQLAKGQEAEREAEEDAEFEDAKKV